MQRWGVAFVLISQLVSLVPGMVPSVLALRDEFKISERATASHRACQEIIRLAKKYEVEEVLPKGFEAGEVACPRLDLAVALQLIIDKMAAKVAKEGAQAVDRRDLEAVSDLREELRGEMLLVQARTFRVQTEELGTRLHALTRDISLSGGLTGIFQGSQGNRPRDHADVVARGELFFNFKVGENTSAVIDFSATGGNGIDAQIPNFSVLNDIAGSTGSRVEFRKGWLEHVAFKERLTLTIGKIGLEDYFDANDVANDASTQLVANSFVNSAVLGQPAKGPGVRVQVKPAEPFSVGLGYATGDAGTDDIFDHPYLIAEADYAAKVADRKGNYRLYGSMDGARPDGVNKLLGKNAFGFGTSIDQQLTEKLTIFGRYGRRDERAYRKKSAWSTGFRYAGPIPARKDDLLSFAYGQVQAAGTSSDEKLAELDYKAKVSDHIEVTPFVQYLINPEGDRARNNVVVMGLRTFVVF